MQSNRIIQTGPAQANAGLLPYGEFFVAIGDADIYGIDWDGWLANYWGFGAIVPPGAVIRPRIPAGQEFLTTLGGQSGSTEPVWPGTSGQPVTDGGVVWTAQPVSTASLSATVASAAWTFPSGITVSGQALSGQLTSAVLNPSGATAGANYTVNVVATMSDGETKTGRIVLKVR